MKKKNSPLRSRIMKIWEEGMEATDWGLGQDSLRRGLKPRLKNENNTFARRQRRWAFSGEKPDVWALKRKRTWRFHMEWNQNHLPSCMSKAFSQYQCPLLILFNIESILEVIRVVLGQGSWLLCKGDLSNHIWASLWDRTGCNMYNQDGPAPGICLNLAEQRSRPHWPQSTSGEERPDMNLSDTPSQWREKERTLALWPSSPFVWGLAGCARWRWVLNRSYSGLDMGQGLHFVLLYAQSQGQCLK